MTDEVVQPTPGSDGSPPGHIEKMLGRKVDDTGEETTGSGETEVVGSNGSVTERPSDIPEKFWDAEKGEVNTAALLKSQQDAEAALRQTQNNNAGEETKDDNDAEADAKPAGDQSNVVASATAEFTEKGELAADTYKALEGVGLSKDMVDTYISGQQAIISKLQESAYEPFEGGKEGYEAAANWAAANLTDDEVAALDVQLTSTNPAIVKQGAKALAKAHAAGADVEPSTIRGNSNNPATGGVYRSRAEMIKDMGSARYRTDAGFRNEVRAKLGRSKLSG